MATYTAGASGVVSGVKSFVHGYPGMSGWKGAQTIVQKDVSCDDAAEQNEAIEILSIA